MSLLKEIIKIALAHPETREHLVPLLKQGSHIENREITITTSMGNREVKALVLENWAVHKSFSGSGWAVTHTPTGLMAMKAPTQQKALGILEVISRNPALLAADTKAEVLAHSADLVALRNQVSGRKPVIDIEGILTDAMLYKQGERYGKSGDFWGITGSSRMIAVGARDVMLNVFYVGIHRPEQLNRPDTRWVLFKSELKTRMTEELLRKWVAWAKQGMTTKELREVARNEYLMRNDPDDMVSVAGWRKKSRLSMSNLRSKLVKLAHDVPELRKNLVPLLRLSMEFLTKDALDVYLKAHPGADRAKHKVVETKRETKRPPTKTQSKPGGHSLIRSGGVMR